MSLLRFASQVATVGLRAPVVHYRVSPTLSAFFSDSGDDSESTASLPRRTYSTSSEGGPRRKSRGRGGSRAARAAAENELDDRLDDADIQHLMKEYAATRGPSLNQTRREILDSIPLTGDPEVDRLRRAQANADLHFMSVTPEEQISLSELERLNRRPRLDYLQNLMDQSRLDTKPADSPADPEQLEQEGDRLMARALFGQLPNPDQALEKMHIQLKAGGSLTGPILSEEEIVTRMLEAQERDRPTPERFLQNLQEHAPEAPESMRTLLQMAEAKSGVSTKQLEQEWERDKLEYKRRKLEYLRAGGIVDPMHDSDHSDAEMYETMRVASSRLYTKQDLDSPEAMKIHLPGERLYTDKEIADANYIWTHLKKVETFHQVAEELSHSLAQQQDMPERSPLRAVEMERLRAERAARRAESWASPPSMASLYEGDEDPGEDSDSRATFNSQRLMNQAMLLDPRSAEVDGFNATGPAHSFTLGGSAAAAGATDDDDDDNGPAGPGDRTLTPMQDAGAWGSAGMWEDPPGPGSGFDPAATMAVLPPADAERRAAILQQIQQAQQKTLLRHHIEDQVVQAETFNRQQDKEEENTRKITQSLRRRLPEGKQHLADLKDIDLLTRSPEQAATILPHFLEDGMEMLKTLRNPDLHEQKADALNAEALGEALITSADQELEQQVEIHRRLLAINEKLNQLEEHLPALAQHHQVSRFARNIVRHASATLQNYPTQLIQDQVEAGTLVLPPPEVLNSLRHGHRASATSSYLARPTLHVPRPGPDAYTEPAARIQLNPTPLAESTRITTMPYSEFSRRFNSPHYDATLAHLGSLPDIDSPEELALPEAERQEARIGTSLDQVTRLEQTMSLVTTIEELADELADVRDSMAPETLAFLDRLVFAADIAKQFSFGQQVDGSFDIAQFLDDSLGDLNLESDDSADESAGPGPVRVPLSRKAAARQAAAAAAAAAAQAAADAESGFPGEAMFDTAPTDSDDWQHAPSAGSIGVLRARQALARAADGSPPPSNITEAVRAQWLPGHLQKPGTLASYERLREVAAVKNAASPVDLSQTPLERALRAATGERVDSLLADPATGALLGEQTRVATGPHALPGANTMGQPAGGFFSNMFADSADPSSQSQNEGTALLMSSPGKAPSKEDARASLHDPELVKKALSEKSAQSAGSPPGTGAARGGVALVADDGHKSGLPSPEALLSSASLGKQFVMGSLRESVSSHLPLAVSDLVATKGINMNLRINKIESSIGQSASQSRAFNSRSNVPNHVRRLGVVIRDSLNEVLSSSTENQMPPLTGNVGIRHVEMSSDGSNAFIHWYDTKPHDVLGLALLQADRSLNPAKVENLPGVIAAMQARIELMIPKLQYVIGDHVQMKYVPSLHIIYDASAKILSDANSFLDSFGVDELIDDFDGDQMDFIEAAGRKSDFFQGTVSPMLTGDPRAEYRAYVDRLLEKYVASKIAARVCRSAEEVEAHRKAALVGYLRHLVELHAEDEEQFRRGRPTGDTSLTAVQDQINVLSEILLGPTMPEIFQSAMKAYQLKEEQREQRIRSKMRSDVFRMADGRLITPDHPRYHEIRRRYVKEKAEYERHLRSVADAEAILSTGAPASLDKLRESIRELQEAGRRPGARADKGARVRVRSAAEIERAEEHRFSSELDALLHEDGARRSYVSEAEAAEMREAETLINEVFPMSKEMERAYLASMRVASADERRVPSDSDSDHEGSGDDNAQPPGSDDEEDIMRRLHMAQEITRQKRAALGGPAATEYDPAFDAMYAEKFGDAGLRVSTESLSDLEAADEWRPDPPPRPSARRFQEDIFPTVYDEEDDEGAPVRGRARRRRVAARSSSATGEEDQE
ncbi:hypothetical protein H696_04984 [Fonticula alba]|uniref:Uncharacterized protein n=1 Tax=Fonticula alba TaxID=691883 RepID=A0A058Z3I1_FONAL|nr:hypothetical protein H696_04984 [Fonticula alba]KCV68696.1 hypothetical protein H696_04984 [Fonticula alba]|eukprot:XP_009497128.1 hypothetical protein H696_04984 [Fonticula alba]